VPLPLPNLDTRRWSDLVDEGRALIPRYAPTWTDQNVSDPGITLIELLAWLVEQEIFRVNRVPARHRRKLLALAGFTPRPPRAAHAAVTFRAEAFRPGQRIPAGSVVTFEADDGSTITFRTRSPLTVSPARLQTIQSFDGTGYLDQTRRWLQGEPFAALGDDPGLPGPAEPDRAPALYLGFDSDLSAVGTLSLWLRPDGERSGWHERERLGEPATHHAARLAWEYFDGDWRTLPAGPDGADDATRALTLEGAVTIAVPTPMQPVAVGAVADQRCYLRARLAAGPLDAAPVLLGVHVNTVGARQAVQAMTELTIAAGVVPRDGHAPTPGTTEKLWLEIGPDGIVTGLESGPEVDGPSVAVLAYQPATSTRAGHLEVPLAFAGLADGSPSFETSVPGAPIDGGEMAVWTMGPTRAERWQLRPDLDGSGPADAHVAVDATDGTIRFGDGRRGRAPAAGAAILAAFQSTAGTRGNLAAGRAGRLDRRVAGLDESTDRRPDAVLAGPGTGGADLVSLALTAARAARTLWAHERLTGLLDRNAELTLDQLGRDAVLALAPPVRATTLADYERLALDVPGTVVRRARAWAGIDPRYPGLQAAGTVTVIVVPALPRRAPSPSRALLRTVHAYLGRRSVVGTRLVVVGPTYVTIAVRATVRARAGADPERVRQEVVARLDGLLDPLTGGPNGRGWPFGRDVYRSEILQAIDGVAGVDHVLSLSMTRDAGGDQWGNIGVGPTELAAPGQHAVQVVRP
jgi:hypothetical protein